jgi:hypothetical protein
MAKLLYFGIKCGMGDTAGHGLNKYNQIIVQIFITHFIPLLVLRKIHRENILSTLAMTTRGISTNLRSL